MEAARETARDQLRSLFIPFRVHLFFIIDKSIFINIENIPQQSSLTGRDSLCPRNFPSYDLICSLVIIPHFPLERLSHVQNVVIAEEFNTARFWRVHKCGVARDSFLILTYNLVIEKRSSTEKNERAIVLRFCYYILT